MTQFIKKIPGLRSEIGRKFILYILLFSSVITFIGTGVQLYLDFKRDLNSIYNTFEQIESSYLNSIINSLWVTDVELLRIQLEGISRLPDIQFIEVQKDENVIETVGIPQAESIIKRSIPLVYVYNNRNIHLGELHITASLKGIYARIFDQILVILCIQTIKTFLVSIFIFIIFYQLVGRHIIYMASFVETVGFESMDKPLQLNQKSKTNKPDELDKLTTAFNRMRENLVRDITERKQIESALQQSEKDLKASQQKAHLGSWHLDLNTNKVVWTEELYKMYGFDPNLPPPPYIEHMKLFTSKSWEMLSTALERTRITGNSYELELETVREDGSNGWMWVRGEAVKDSDGKTIGLWGAAQDISERKKIANQLQQNQKIESIGNLAGGIAHDFNNLLFPIIGMAELLLEDLPHDSPEHENAQEIFNAGKRASDLVKQILSFSRQSEHKMTSVRIQKVLKEVLKLSRSTIPSNIEIREDIDWECGLVIADDTQIHQVAMNLITNAFHAIEEKNGIIVVTLKQITLEKGDISEYSLPPGQYIKLSVTDNGTGIPQSIQNKIFDPYFTTKQIGRGTGLGLAVVYGIIKEHKGDIKVYSEEGKGSTFNVYLPLTKTNTMPVLDNQSLKLPTGTEKILLVDDEISVAKLESQMLSRLGYQVTELTDSSEALNEFKTNPANFDLVISDMTMPNMTGDQLAKEILSIKPDIPIIICTGFSERVNKEQAEVLGVKGFLMKPVGKYDMAQMVRNVLDNAKIS